MRSFLIAGLPAVLAAALTACAGSGGSAASSSGPSSASPAAAASSAAATPSAAAASGAPAASGSAGAAASPPDPCELVTQSEASALTGVSFGPGKEETVPGPGGERRCVYGSQTTNVFNVAVVRAASVKQAQTVKASLLAQAQQEFGTTLTLTSVTGVGDDAEAVSGTVSGAGTTIALSGLYVLKGVIGFALIDAAAGASAPSRAALVAQAGTTLSRLP